MLPGGGYSSGGTDPTVEDAEDRIQHEHAAHG